MPAVNSWPEAGRVTAMLRSLRKWVRGVDREVNGLVRNSSNDGSDALSQLVLSRSGGGWVFARRAGSRKPRVSRCPSSEEPPLRGFTAEKRARNNILVCFGARIWLHEFEPPRARSRGSKISRRFPDIWTPPSHARYRSIALHYAPSKRPFGASALRAMPSLRAS